jgi:hypothetical protein
MGAVVTENFASSIFRVGEPIHPKCLCLSPNLQNYKILHVKRLMLKCSTVRTSDLISCDVLLSSLLAQLPLMRPTQVTCIGQMGQLSTFYSLTLNSRRLLAQASCSTGQTVMVVQQYPWHCWMAA